MVKSPTRLLRSSIAMRMALTIVWVWPSALPVIGRLENTLIVPLVAPLPALAAPPPLAAAGGLVAAAGAAGFDWALPLVPLAGAHAVPNNSARQTSAGIARPLINVMAAYLLQTARTPRRTVHPTRSV